MMIQYHSAKHNIPQISMVCKTRKVTVETISKQLLRALGVSRSKCLEGQRGGTAIQPSSYSSPGLVEEPMVCA